MHSFRRKSFTVILAVVMILAFLLLLDLALYPCTFIRNDVHAVITEKKDLVILGSSNGKMDLDPDVLLENTGKTGHNLCVGGEYPVDAYYITKLLIEKNKPEQILFELNPGYFMTRKEPGNNYLLFYHEFPLSAAKAAYFADTMRDCDLRTVFFPAYEYSLFYEIPRAPETIRRKLSADYRIDSFKGKVQEYHENGWIEKYPVEVSDFPEYKGFQFAVNDNVSENSEYLRKIADLCRKSDIRFSVAVMPLPETVLRKDSDEYGEAWNYFEEFLNENQIDLYNFNTDYYDSFSHDDSCFVDYNGHMNGKNAKAFSEAAGKILKVRK